MSIQTYIRPYAKLTRSGRDFICACPFHETSDDSMRIYPASNYFECGECGRQGNSWDLRRMLSKEMPAGRLCVYVLLLKNAHFYVGITDNLKKRISQHFAGIGAVWTKKYQPIEVLEIIQNASQLIETRVTCEYMNRYGKERVRGGKYCGLKYH
jgi:predicted GIY-YIG superfamily endonuclease